MATTNFINLNTVIVADWLNDVNYTVYNILSNGGPIPATAANLRTNIGLGSVDNTTDLAKPLSTAATTALSFKVALTGATGSAALPVGTTAQRDGSPVAGYLRYNTTVNAPEVYSGTAWGSVGGGATGAAGDTVFVENSRVVTANYSITSTKSASCVGPITVNSGVTLTVPTGQRLVIL